jgi:hypothetical protein
VTKPAPTHDEAADDLRSMLAELTQPHRHREHYSRQVGGTLWAGDYVTEVLSLLTQLRFASASGQGGSRSGAGFESRPAASLESLVTLTSIDLEVSRWIRDLGEDDPTSTTACIALLGGLLPSATRCKLTHGRMGCCTWHEIAADVRGWYTGARIVTGWDAPAWRPDNTCPNCAVRRSLRIRLAERVGFCVECRETWSPADYRCWPTTSAPSRWRRGCVRCRGRAGVRGRSRTRSLGWPGCARDVGPYGADMQFVVRASGRSAMMAVATDAEGGLMGLRRAMMQKMCGGAGHYAGWNGHCRRCGKRLGSKKAWAAAEEAEFKRRREQVLRKFR